LDVEVDYYKLLHDLRKERQVILRNSRKLRTILQRSNSNAIRAAITRWAKFEIGPKRKPSFSKQLVGIMASQSPYFKIFFLQEKDALAAELGRDMQQTSDRTAELTGLFYLFICLFIDLLIYLFIYLLYI
jgi:hypothetical protein